MMRNDDFDNVTDAARVGDRASSELHDLHEYSQKVLLPAIGAASASEYDKT
jgi:hypothetical protein